MPFTCLRTRIFVYLSWYLLIHVQKLIPDNLSFKFCLILVEIQWIFKNIFVRNHNSPYGVFAIRFMMNPLIFINSQNKKYECSLIYSLTNHTLMTKPKIVFVLKTTKILINTHRQRFLMLLRSCCNVMSIYYMYVTFHW